MKQIWILEYLGDDALHFKDTDFIGFFENEILAKKSLPKDLQWVHSLDHFPEYEEARLSEGVLQLYPCQFNMILRRIP